MHVHILGICGTLMGSIALLAKQQGHEVSGCDENIYPPMSDQLRQAGIAVAGGYSRENIPPDADLIMIGNANLPRGNPAVEYVLDKGLPYVSGAEWLGKYLLADRWVIAVAGTHGKTTTTSMVAWILEYAGMAPGYLVGGVPANFDESARLGDTPFFVIEADEYDTSYFDRRSKFLHYRPRTAILNNLEYDHADIFPDLDAIKNQFNLLLRTIPATGLIIHPADDDALQDVFERGCWTPRSSFTITTGGGPAAADLVGEAIEPDGSGFTVTLNSAVDDTAPALAGTVRWTMTGMHNIHNALAAISAARHVGVPVSVACEALSEFKGVKRRMEIIYQTPALTLYEDFAHHPTAIQTTLAGLRAKVGDGPILAVIEPGSHTMRLGTHADTLKAAATDADHVIWFKPATAGWDMEATLSGDGVDILSTTAAVTARILAITRQADTPPWQVIIMSNGSFGGLYKMLLAQLPDA